MKTWLSASHLAGLPGLPGTQQNVTTKARRDAWQSRPRKARGGGREYHITSLPQETRAHLAAEHVNRINQNSNDAKAGAAEGRKLAMASAFDNKIRAVKQETGAVAALNITGNTAARINAKLRILQAIDDFANSSHLKPTRALEQFCARYNDGEIDIDDEIRSTVDSIDRSTVHRWRKRMHDEGVIGLGGHYKNNAPRSKIDQQPDLHHFVVAMLTDHPHASAAHVIKACRARFADSAIKLPGKRSFERWINSWKNNNSEIYTAITNPDAWKGRFMVAFGSQSEDVIALNQRWELDSTPADIMLTDGRHNLIGIIDVYSRRAKLLVSRTSVSSAVAAVTRKALLDWGVPEVAKTDNGKDYVSNHMVRVFKSLGIQQELCPPFQPWHKPHVERFFHTFSHDLIELLPGYIGHDVAERSAIESRKSFSDRLLKKDAVVEINMSADELQTFCDNWVDNVYHQQPHGGLKGKTPFEVAAAWKDGIRRIENERALDVLLAEAPGGSGTRTITKKGIRLDNFTYIHETLALHSGETVHVRYDEYDIGRIYVFSDEEFICIAECPEITGISREEVAARAREI